MPTDAASPTPPLTARVEIAAPPSAVWRVVSDVRRTGEWSPECRGVTPVGALRRGTYLVGRNRRGLVWWATVSKVTRFEEQRALGWTVLQNRAEWRYELEPTETGTVLVQTREMPRGESPFAVWFANRLLGGLERHDEELRRGMADGLGRIKDLVERPGR